MSFDDAQLCDLTPRGVNDELQVRFTWKAAKTDGTAPAIHVVEYDYEQPSKTLRRLTCKDGVLLTNDTLGRQIEDVIITCAPAAAPGNRECSGAPTSITVKVIATTNSDGSAPYEYSLTAAFRKVLSGPAPPASNPSPLIVLGTGNCSSGDPGPGHSGATGVEMAGNARVEVYGDAYVNAADGLSCSAMNLENDASFDAVTTSILTGGTCVDNPSNSRVQCPVPPKLKSHSPPVADPYAHVVAPSAAGRPSQTGLTCGTTGTAEPGVYAQPLVIANDDTCTLASGVYILQAGLTVGSGGVIRSGPGGVLLYFAGGVFSVEQDAEVTLTAMTGEYADLVVWEATDSPNSFTSGARVTLNGTLYAPTARLALTGDAQDPIVYAIVAQRFYLANGSGIRIGGPDTPPSITSLAPLPTGTVGQPYTTTLTATGGSGTLTWSSGGDLPDGLTLDTGTGEISGTPTTPEATIVVVTVHDSLGHSSFDRPYTISIAA